MSIVNVLTILSGITGFSVETRKASFFNPLVSFLQGGFFLTIFYKKVNNSLFFVCLINIGDMIA